MPWIGADRVSFSAKSGVYEESSFLGASRLAPTTLGLKAGEGALRGLRERCLVLPRETMATGLTEDMAALPTPTSSWESPTAQ